LDTLAIKAASPAGDFGMTLEVVELSRNDARTKHRVFQRHARTLGTKYRIRSFRTEIATTRT